MSSVEWTTEEIKHVMDQHRQALMGKEYGRATGMGFSSYRITAGEKQTEHCIHVTVSEKMSSEELAAKGIHPFPSFVVAKLLRGEYVKINVDVLQKGIRLLWNVNAGNLFARRQ